MRHDPARTQQGDVDRIGVLRANALGDLVFTLPALSALRDRFPHAEITLIGRPLHQEFLRSRPSPVDRVEVLPPVPGITVPADAAPPPELSDWLRGQKEVGYDLAVQLHGGGRFSNPLVTALGARLTVGLRASDAPPLDLELPYVYHQNETVRCLEVVSMVGAVGEPYPRLDATPEDLAAAAEALAPLGATRYAVVHPGASDPRRRWPPERFGEVADGLAGRGLAVVVTGTAAERGVVGAVTGAAASEVLDLGGRLSLSGLVGLLSGAEVVVSNDTGPLHVADALGTRSVGIFWCGNLVNGGPLGRARHRPLLSWTVHCPWCGADCTRDLFPARTGGLACAHRPSFVADVPTVEVLDAVDDLLAC